jgi:hypothetical protein
MPGAEITLIRLKPWRRWFAFLGGGIAWTLHLLSIYAIGEFGCVGGWGHVSYWGISAVAWMILIVSMLLLVPAAAATLIGYRDARHDLKQESPTRDDEGGKYLSSFGWILSALFTLIILVESLPVFGYLHGC